MATPCRPSGSTSIAPDGRPPLPAPDVRGAARSRLPGRRARRHRDRAADSPRRADRRARAGGRDAAGQRARGRHRRRARRDGSGGGAVQARLPGDRTRLPGVRGAAMGDLLQDGINFRSEERPDPCYRKLILNAAAGASAASVRDAIAEIWAMLRGLRRGYVRDLKGLDEPRVEEVAEQVRRLPVPDRLRAPGVRSRAPPSAAHVRRAPVVRQLPAAHRASLPSASLDRSGGRQSSRGGLHPPANGPASGGRELRCPRDLEAVSRPRAADHARRFVHGLRAS